MGKSWAVATQIEASGFGVGDGRALEYALSDRKRACVLSLFGGEGWSLKLLSSFSNPEDPMVNCQQT